MKMNPLPPQAYTKETLLKAYSWLQNQSDSVKDLATTPDILISLFTKAQMNGDSSLERPSIQNFKAELKSLAGMMGEFETRHENRTDVRVDTRIENKSEGLLRPQVVTALPHTQPVNSHVTQTQTQKITSNLDLDAKSQAMIREIMTECNLSSELEALRLLVSIGFKKIKNI